MQAGLALLLIAASVAAGQAQGTTAGRHVPVIFSGGHETDPQDRGRPVLLVASALGVPPEVFREAFRHVRPAPAGTRPDPQQVRDNKAALLAALAPYGVTNEDLDSVSDYYRYVRSRGELWPTTPAVAYAVVRRGVVTEYVVVSGGAGYSSPPLVSVPGLPGASAKATLTFSKTLGKNGSVSTISAGAK